MALKDRLSAADDALPGDESAREAALVACYREQLLAEIDLRELSALDETARRVRLERVMGHLLSREGPVLTIRERARTIRRVLDEALGLGILEPLLADESVTEIMVNGPGTVFVERFGRLERQAGGFASEAHLMQVIDRIVAAVNRRVDESSPMVDARLPTGERVNVVVPPLALDGAVLTIRRFPSPYTLDQLVARGSMDEGTAALLAACVRARLSIIVSGGTGTGKTTMLNSLSGLIPSSERIVTVEDSAELSLQQAHVVRLETRPANTEGRGAVTIRDLVRNSLRMRPDRIIVGEVRGGETLDMLQAMNTGHEGSLATVHANSAEDAVVRLETLASMAETQTPFQALRDQINTTVDLVVQLERGVDGTRRVSEVAAVSSRRREEFALTTLTRFEAQPLGRDRVVHGEHVHRPLPALLAERLHLAGEAVPQGFTVAAADDAGARRGVVA